MYKSKLISGTDDNNVNNVKLVVPLKYVSSFFRSLEMPLVKCKIDLELTWHKDCMISSVNVAASQVVSFMITNTKLYIPVVTLSTKDTNIGTHWIALFVKPKYTVYFDSFGIEHIPKDIEHAIGNKEIKANIFRIQAYDSIMCGYFCIEFINYMFDGKSLIDFTSLFSPYDFKKNNQIIKRIFKNE